METITRYIETITIIHYMETKFKGFSCYYSIPEFQEVRFSLFVLIILTPSSTSQRVLGVGGGVTKKESAKQYNLI